MKFEAKCFITKIDPVYSMDFFDGRVNINLNLYVKLQDFSIGLNSSFENIQKLLMKNLKITLEEIEG